MMQCNGKTNGCKEIGARMGANPILSQDDLELRKQYNPYRRKLDRAKEMSLKWSRRSASLNENSIPGTAIIGSSGVKKSYLKKLDRQLDKTIDTAKKNIYWKGQVAYFENMFNKYENGWIDSNGRSISETPKKEKPKKTVNSRKREINLALRDIRIYGFGEFEGKIYGHMMKWSESKKTLIDYAVIVSENKQECRFYELYPKQMRTVDALMALLEDQSCMDASIITQKDGDAFVAIKDNLNDSSLIQDCLMNSQKITADDFDPEKDFDEELEYTE